MRGFRLALLLGVVAWAILAGLGVLGYLIATRL